MVKRRPEGPQQAEGILDNLYKHTQLQIGFGIIMLSISNGQPRERGLISYLGLILSISENGFGKRTPLKDYRLTGRGGKGVINIKTTPRNGKVVAILSVKEDSDVIIISKDGKIIRLESADIRQAGRSTQGVRLVRMEDGDRVAAASVVPETENGDAPKANGQGDLPLQ